MHINFVAVLVAALVPMIMGFIWYNPKTFGTVWMRESNVNMNDGKKMNMPLIYFLCFVLSFILAMAMNFIVIHQMHFFSMLANDPSLAVEGSELNTFFKTTMEKYGSNFRTFKHGALHGTMSAVTVVLPIIATSGMFERKSAKYIFVNWGYWAICFAIMGGIVCGWV